MPEYHDMLCVCVCVCAGECFSGALWWKDLLTLAEEVGFSPPRLVTANIITVDNKELQEVIGLSPFISTVFIGILLYIYINENLLLRLILFIKPRFIPINALHPICVFLFTMIWASAEEIEECTFVNYQEKHFLKTVCHHRWLQICLCHIPPVQGP